jgi:hypothetical protein
MSDERIESHPSYGLARFSRVSGRTNLFGSEFEHQHFMSLTITRAERHRDLSRDWYFGREELIEIDLSEAQFVEMITTPNIGQGVPVTLNHVMGERMPPVPRREETIKVHRAEMKEDARRCMTELNTGIAAFEKAIEAGTLSKGKLREILQHFISAERAVSDALPFVEKQFGEAMENTVARAKTEIDAYVSQMAMRIGVKALQGEAVEQAPKLTEGEK